MSKSLVLLSIITYQPIYINFVYLAGTLTCMEYHPVQTSLSELLSLHQDAEFSASFLD